MFLEKTIFIGNLPKDIKSETVFNLFNTFGDIKDIKYNLEKNDKVYYFVEFNDIEDVDHAIDNYNETIYKGNILRVEKALKFEKKLDKAIWENEEYANKYIN